MDNRNEHPDRAKRAPYVPTPAALGAITGVTTILEGLTLQDRGHVVARLLALYGPKGSPAVGKTAGTIKSKLQIKKDWRKQWEQSPEYKAWKTAQIQYDALPSAKKGDPAEQEHYRVLQASAFRVKRELQGQTTSGPVKQGSKTLLSSAGQTGGQTSARPKRLTVEGRETSSPAKRVGTDIRTHDQVMGSA